jgi:hypothetical protein
MSDLIKSNTSDRYADWRKARRAQEAGSPSLIKDGMGSLPLEPDASGAMADRLKARRVKQSEGTSQGGEGEGSVGKEIAREPLFVGLGIRGHHHAGQKDSEAPPMKPTQSPRACEDLGKPDPQPVRSRRPRM